MRVKCLDGQHNTMFMTLARLEPRLFDLEPAHFRPTTLHIYKLNVIFFIEIFYKKRRPVSCVAHQEIHFFQEVRDLYQSAL